MLYYSLPKGNIKLIWEWLPMSKAIIKNRFKDQVMIITGAAGGIGKAAAIRAAKEGAKLVLADQKEQMSKNVSRN